RALSRVRNARAFARRRRRRADGADQPAQSGAPCLHRGLRGRGAPGCGSRGQGHSLGPSRRAASRRPDRPQRPGRTPGTRPPGRAPVAIGTDTGGSVRIPAAWCGIVGLKVTAGRISTYGVLPLSSTLDTPGPLARSVEDAALIYRALSGPDPRDPQTFAWTPA